MTRPVILDHFCGGGGAAKGYHDAGFDVIGFDINPQPRYPYDFIRLNSADLSTWAHYLPIADAIHASPPCQRYSIQSYSRPGLRDTYPDLIGPMRNILRITGLPFIIENVPQAPLINPVRMCGEHLGLTGEWKGDRVALRRHRDFEVWGFNVDQMHHPRHKLRAVTVAGHSGRNGAYWRGPGYAQLCRELMEIDWLRRDELDEAIPPAYTRYVGGFLMNHLNRSVERLAA